MSSVRKRCSDGFTLIEMVLILVMLALGLLGAKFFYSYFPGWLGGLSGFVAGIAVFMVGMAIFALVMDYWVGGVPRLPKCRNGCCCGPNDYKTGKVGEKLVHVCKCGGNHRRNGRRFVVVNDDGSETSYLIWRRFRGWYPDILK